MRRFLTKLADLLFGSPRIGDIEERILNGSMTRAQFEREKRRQDEKVRWLKMEAEVWANRS